MSGPLAGEGLCPFIPLHLGSTESNTVRRPFDKHLRIGPVAHPNGNVAVGNSRCAPGAQHDHRSSDRRTMSIRHRKDYLLENDLVNIACETKV
jgi:hypothetical protein